MNTRGLLFASTIVLAAGSAFADEAAPVHEPLVIPTPVVTPATTETPCSDFQEVWSKCSSDEDCVIGESVCYGVQAYNKEHLKAVEHYNECMRPAIRCAAPPKDDKLKTKPVCSEDKCLAIQPGLKIEE